MRQHRSLLLIGLLLLVMCGALPSPLFAAPGLPAGGVSTSAAQSPAVSPEEVAHLQGAYSPNTQIAWHADALWFIRPPYQSALIPVGDGTFLFAQGWLAGRSMYFAPNESGGISIMLWSDTGDWVEFARSGEIYPDLNPVLRRSLEELLERTVDHTNVPGAALYVSIPGQGVWLGARGLADQGRGIPMVPLDRFRIASVTKTFVATVILQLMQEGWLTLDDTVERWLPGVVPNGDRINLRHLLTHTSGLYDYLDNGFMDRVMADRGRTWSPYELVAYAVSHPPYFGPGEPERWRYSNTNYILLGLVAEQATGHALIYEIRHRIIEPLGLYNTYFDTYESLPGGVTRGYSGTRDYTDINMSFAWAAGGMVSTTEDLGRFAQGLFGGRLLGPAAMDEMRRFVNVYGAWGTTDLVYGDGIMQRMLRITVADPASAGLVWGHTGALMGYRTSMWYLPQSGITVVATTNQMYSEPNELVTRAIDIILAHN